MKASPVVAEPSQRVLSAGPSQRLRSGDIVGLSVQDQWLSADPDGDTRLGFSVADPRAQ